MPPSVEFLEHLVATKEPSDVVRVEVGVNDPIKNYETKESKDTNTNTSKELDTCSMLHSLLLLPRIEHKVLGSWIKDCLVKQGQTMAKAEELVKKIKSFNTFAYDLSLIHI